MTEGKETDFTHLVQDREMCGCVCGLNSVCIFATGMVMKLSLFCLAPSQAQIDLVL